MRPIGRSVSAALALLILAAVGTVFLRGRSTHIPARLETPGTVQSADLLELQSKNLAGPDAVDCGRVPVGGDPKVATECALAAQTAGKPFRVRYDIRGIDSFIAVAIVRTPIGTVGTLQYDSDPMGGGGRAHESGLSQEVSGASASLGEPKRTHQLFSEGKLAAERCDVPECGAVLESRRRPVYKPGPYWG